MKIMITAGGTTERIDSVRSITNTSSGKLGSLIADAFANIPDTEKIYYICGKNAIKPQSEKTDVIYIDTVASLETAVRKIIEEVSVDIIVHSMAVSDYRVSSITCTSLLAKSIQSGLDLQPEDKQQITEAFTRSLFESNGTLLSEDGKISSNLDNLILFMERTPKIISLFQTLAPGATLVGFKLLDHVTEEALIDTAFHILQENKCSFVLANDLRDITGERHTGYLVDKNKNYTRHTTKAEIADAIAAAAIQERKKVG